MPVGPFRTYTQPVNLRDLDRFEAGEEVTPETLKAKGLIRSIRKDVKLLGVGELTKKLTITVHGASATAREKVEAAGGTLTLLKEPKVAQAEEPEAAARGPDEGRPTQRRRARRRPRPRAAEPDGRRGVSPAVLARQRVAGPGAPAPGAVHGGDPRRVPARLVDARAGRRLRARSRTTSTARAASCSACSTCSSGSALSRFSIFALGIMPYVTASIILQLLTVVIPTARAAAEGGRGRATRRSTSTRAT